MRCLFFRTFQLLASLTASGSIFVASVHSQDPKPQDAARSGQASATQYAFPGTGGRTVRPGEEVRLRDAARRLRSSVVFLGRNDGFHGTGVIISRDHRLVLTAGHVADGFFEEGSIFAVLEGGFQVRRVTAVWYHPMLKRELDYCLQANSFDPADGPTWYPSADLAVLELSKEGGELPKECDLGMREEPRNVQDHAVGILGYWVEQGESWPTAVRPARASFSASVIRPASSEDERVKLQYKSFVYCDIGFVEGGSGGPVFLDDGSVVGIVVSGAPYSRFAGRLDELRVLRIDRLRELIAYHKLQGAMPKLVKTAAVCPGWGPDPRLDELRTAVSLVRRAGELRRVGSYKGSVEICNSALRIAPDYGGALLERSKAYLFYLGTNWQRLTAEERRRYSGWAISDSDRCNELDAGPIHPRMIHLQAILYECYAHSDPSGFKLVVEATSQHLRPGWTGETFTSYERSFALNLRGQAYHLLGEAELAKRDYDESLRLEPQEPRWYLNRAQFWESQNRPDLARADRTKAEHIRQLRRNSGIE
jgi:tetratricopeptide (TPR) repeat protein